MRPGQHQQNRRGRGRNNGGNNGGNNGNIRKGQNPLSRSFESNGPDVKVRGTPAHIAEKYLALARDAQSSGDRVLAENYLQHAEHYNRIIMAYREQFQTPAENNQPQRRMPGMEGFDPNDDGSEDDANEAAADDFGGGPQPVGTQGQGVASPQDANGNGGGQHQHRQPYRQHEGRQDHQQNRYDNQQRGDRPFRRDGQQQNNRFQNRNDRNNRPYGGNNNGQPPNGQQNYGDRDRDRSYDQRFDRGDRQDRGDRGPRPDRPVRIDRNDERMDRPPQQPTNQTSYEPPQAAAPAHVQPAQPLAHEPPSLPPFVAQAVQPVAPVAPVAAPPAAHAPARRRERAAEQPGNDAPDFLKRPVRRTRAAATSTTEPAAPERAPPETPGDDSTGGK